MPCNGGLSRNRNAVKQNFRNPPAEVGRNLQQNIIKMLCRCLALGSYAAGCQFDFTVVFGGNINIVFVSPEIGCERSVACRNKKITHRCRNAVRPFYEPISLGRSSNNSQFTAVLPLIFKLRNTVICYFNHSANVSVGTLNDERNFDLIGKKPRLLCNVTLNVTYSQRVFMFEFVLVSPSVEKISVIGNCSKRYTAAIINIICGFLNITLAKRGYCNFVTIFFKNRTERI